jgi:endonuclease-8
VPEGDTIHRAARTLHGALAGKIVTRFETVLPRLERERIVGRTIEKVAAAGKHLIISFSGDLHLRTHLRMNGSWHIYPPGARWQRPRGDMRIVIGTADYEAVAFRVPVAELHDGRSLARELDDLGPDLLASDFDPAEAVRRIRERGAEPIADVLLNQRVLAGIGNVYKSEVLFLRRVHPLTPASSLDEETLLAILETSRKLMKLNAAPGASGRRTTGAWPGEAPLWVYGRRGEPCRRCGARIEMRKQGSDARVTYWCPGCQPVQSAL